MRTHHAVLIIVATLSVGLTALATRADDDNWPQFLGPGSRAVAANPSLPDRWSASENVAWKTDIPGRGWSSPIVWGNRVFLTTVVAPESSELPKKGLYRGGEKPEVPASEYQWKVFCLDLFSGKVLWERTVHQGPPSGPTHSKNSYASETPVTDGQRVYALFGDVGVYCFDMEGRPVWQKAIAPHKRRLGWGTAASPVLHGDRLYLVDDNEEQSYLLALDKRSGEEVWRVDRDEKSNWSTPYVWQTPQRTEIVTPGTGKVRSYDLDGKLLWWFRGMSGITIGTPYADQGLLYLSSGYVGDKKKPLYAIRPGATGDISLASEENSNLSIAWCNRTAAPYNPTTLVYDGRLYVLLDRGMLSAFDSQTGKPIYEQKPLPDGQHFTSSPWAYRGKVFCQNEDGLTFVGKAGDEFEVLHTNKLPEDEMYLATPAIVGDRLLIRSSARVYCIRSDVPAPPAAAFWLVRPELTEAKIRQWAKKYPTLVSLEEQRTFHGRTAFAVTVTDPRVDDKGKKKLVFSQPHAHEPASTAGMMDFLSQVLDGVHLDGQKATLAGPDLLQKTVLTFIPDGNPDGRARAPVDWWDGTKYANREFGQFMFGRAKDGSNFPRVGRWNIRDMQPAWLGIAYEQINDDEYVEPNRDRASTYFKLLLRMSAKYAYDAHLDLHQTEFERSKYNASVVLPFSQKDLPEPVRTANQQLGDFIVKALRDGGGTPMPEARPLDYAEDQIRFFRAAWGDIFPTRPEMMIEIQNNNVRTPPREQMRLTELAIRAGIDFFLGAKRGP